MSEIDPIDQYAEMTLKSDHCVRDAHFSAWDVCANDWFVWEEQESFFKNKRVCITGILPTMNRSEASKLILQHGGVLTSTVNKGTHFLLCGDKPGTKLSKAVEMGIPVLNENEFIRRLK